MTFPEACSFLGREGTRPSTLAGSRPAKPQWEPRVTTAPTDLWQERARRLVEESENWLFQPSTFAQTMLGWLKERRGLSEETIKEHRLGLVLIDRWEGHEQWGLEPVLKDDGTPKKIWIPRGLTIPLWQDGKIYRIRIRRPKFALRSEADPRYYLLRGSDTRAMILGTDKPVSIIVESELDALLLHQEAGDLVNVISLGNAQTRPDQQAADLLKPSRLILVALDADQAGAKESWQMVEGALPPGVQVAASGRQGPRRHAGGGRQYQDMGRGRAHGIQRCCRPTGAARPPGRRRRGTRR